MTEKSAQARDTALALLSRREHAEQELAQKLTARGYPPDTVAGVISTLKSEGLQSDSRYTEAYVHSRVTKGYGPVRILQELKQRGIAAELANAYIEDGSVDWQEQMQSTRARKFGSGPAKDYKDQARQSRFLQYRGFTTEQIRDFFRNSRQS